eukprot:c39926_g1_i1 orf=1-153(-)
MALVCFLQIKFYIAANQASGQLLSINSRNSFLPPQFPEALSSPLISLSLSL